MTFSYTLLLALVLLFPGLCAWGGLRLVERTDLLSPRPDRPNSTATLFVIVLGTLVGHLIGTGVFAAQALWCDWTGFCFTVPFDPNVYRVLLSAGKTQDPASDAALFVWLLELIAAGVAGVAVAALAQWKPVRKEWDALNFGWLNEPVQAVQRGKSVVLAYVMTKTTHEGAIIAYEGIVQQLAVDEDQAITMLVLVEVDRFLVRITGEGVDRDDEEHQPISQMQFHLSEIANVALEIIEDLDVGDEPEVEPAVQSE